MWRPRKLFPPLPTRDWRRTAAVNSLLATIVSIVLTGILIWSVTTAGSLKKSLVFYEGSCMATSRLNLLLHFVINIASTCLIASSNYFMQVLSSPTRDEIDKAHAKSHFLEIGVPSFRNIGYIAKPKAIIWLLLVISSVPIHVFFNSTVFETDYQGAGFFMTMATEAFIDGREYHGPGASLINPGAPFLPDAANDIGFDGHGFLDPGWGSPASMAQFLNNSSSALRNLSSVSKEAKSWNHLDAHDCRAQYGTCTPRRDYGNVVLVIDAQLQAFRTAQEDDTAGFIVDDIYNLTKAGVPWDPHNYTTDELREYWDRFGSISNPNPLWFSAWCQIFTVLGAGSQCSHTCATAIGLPMEYYILPNDQAISSTTTSWDIPLAYYNASPNTAEQNLWSEATIEERPTFNRTSSFDTSLRITHCYAQPLQDVCKIALSNTLLLIVTLCSISKTVLSFLARTVLQGNPLVTPGDAMVSFIARPDCTTIGQGWRKRKSARIAAGISRAVWVHTYSITLTVLVITVVLLAMATNYTPFDSDTGAFDHSQNSAIAGSVVLANASFLGKVLLANSPQLALSLLYFAYNGLITRACAEVEWNSFSLAYKPLRVSQPQDGQNSTYRLQMPYRYGIPIMALSILLHWLVSNAIYIYIVEGDYLTEGVSMNLPGLSASAYVNVGYSSIATLVVLILAIVIAMIPIATCKHLKGNMIICCGRSNVISASCHASTLNIQKCPVTPEGSIEMQPLMLESALVEKQTTEAGADQSQYEDNAGEPEASPPWNLDEMSRGEVLLQITRSKLRWGVVDMPPEWNLQFSGAESEAEHLTFGTGEQDVKEPQDGKYYT